MNESENKEMNTEPKSTETQNNCLKKDCWKKCLAMTLAAFLGGFLAVYFVTDQMYKHRPMPPQPQIIFDKFQPENFEEPFGSPEDIEKDIMAMKKHQERMIKDLERSPWAMKPFFANPVKISTDVNNNEFVVKLNLKHLNNDAQNINYKVNGRKLTINGKSKIKDKDYENQVSFSQDLILPEKAKVDELSTTVQDNHWILSIPIEK